MAKAKVQAKKKKCKAGWQCGKGCISRKKTCRKNLKDPKGKALAQTYAQYVAAAAEASAPAAESNWQEHNKKAKQQAGFEAMMYPDKRRKGENFNQASSRMYEENRKPYFSDDNRPKPIANPDELVKEIESRGTKVGQGAFGTVYVMDGRAYKIQERAIDSNLKTSEFIRETRGSELQNEMAKTGKAPRVYSMGQTSRGEVVTEMDYLENHVPVYKLQGPALTKATKEIKKIIKEMKKKGIEHNDTHTGNFMVDTKTGEVKVIDFGLATINGEL